MMIDRNLQGDRLGNCSTGIRDIFEVQWSRTSPDAVSEKVQWTNGLHGAYGNLGLGDGSVLGGDRTVLAHTLQFGDANGTLHFVMP